MIIPQRLGRAGWKHQARLDYLMARPESWAQAPSVSDDVTDENRVWLKILEKEMLQAGLLGRCVPSEERVWTIRLLIGELRALQRLKNVSG